MWTTTPASKLSLGIQEKAREAGVYLSMLEALGSLGEKRGDRDRDRVGEAESGP
jgi:hypothetical protein